MTTRRDFLKNLAGLAGLALTSGVVGATMKGVATAAPSDIVPALPPSVPALLTPGEYVISRKWTEKYSGFLEEINSDHEIILGLDLNSGDVCEYEADGSFGAHITTIKVSAKLGRDEINELGRRGPYHRFVKFPSDTTEEIK